MKTVDISEASKRLGITLEDAKHYGTALIRWTLRGFPIRPQEEVDRIWEELCKPCKHYHYIEQRCTKCRCRANKSRIPLMNKLKMATERCDVGKW